MLNKKILFIAAALIGVLPAYSEELLENGSFEEFTTSSFMSIHSAAFTSWTLGNAFGSNVDSTDVIDGKYAFISNSTELKKAAVLYQSVDCYQYAVADTFKIRICYKNLNDSTVRLCSYWTASAGSDPIAQEPALNQELPLSSDWDTVEIITVKPEGARNFEFRVEVKKKGSVKFDNFSFEYLTPTVPYFTITPEKGNYSITANINTDTVVAKIAVRQYNLTQPVKLEITGTGKAAFSIDKTQMTKTEDTVTVRFKATKMGKYSAVLNITDDESPTTSLMNRTVQLDGTAVDTTKAPIITITPMEFDTFRCKAYETVTDTFVVKSENCYDFVHVMVDDETGDPWAFGLSSSFFGKNTTDTVVITFAPVKAGNYTAKFIAYTSGITDTIRFAVAGVAEDGKPKPIDVDWDTTFVWNTHNPYKTMDEGFDHADTCRNKTLKTTDWQNVVTTGQRPWWGFYSDSTKQAKMTSYYYQTDSGSVAMETWLVTPALDYKNASPKIFSFSVMSDLIYKGQTGKLELYFIDPTDPKKIYFEHVQAVDTMIPANNDELEYNWVPIVMDLSKVSNMPDVFFMAFRFTDKGGNNGVTYYITDVTWGIGATGMINVNANENVNHMSDVHKFVNNGKLYILKDGKQYNILGQLQ